MRLVLLWGQQVCKLHTEILRAEPSLTLVPLSASCTFLGKLLAAWFRLWCGVGEESLLGQRWGSSPWSLEVSVSPQ